MRRLVSWFISKEMIITAILFVIIWGLSFIPFNCAFISPIESAIGDFDVYDIVFSRLKEEAATDTNIVIVNIGNLSRREIAQEIVTLNQYNPKVIGIDAFFNVEKDPSDDSALSTAFSKCRNVVLVSKLDKYNEDKMYYESYVKSISKFSSLTHAGFANLPNDTRSGFRTIREFRPYERVYDSTVFAFSTTIAGLYDPAAVSQLLERENGIEKINFVGNYNKFYFIDAYPLLAGGDFSFVKDKIVLMGYMGPDLNTKNLEDIFFTPLNERYAGKSFPDMYGIVIHANIISMILRSNYINNLPTWIADTIIVLIVFFYIKLLLYIKSNYKDWFNGLTKLFIFLFTVFILYLSVISLQNYNYKLNLTIVLLAVALSTTIIDLYENYIIRLFHKFPIPGKKYALNN